MFFLNKINLINVGRQRVQGTVFLVRIYLRVVRRHGNSFPPVNSFSTKCCEIPKTPITFLLDMGIFVLSATGHRPRCLLDTPSKIKCQPSSSSQSPPPEQPYAPLVRSIRCAVISAMQRALFFFQLWSLFVPFSIIPPLFHVMNIDSAISVSCECGLQ